MMPATNPVQPASRHTDLFTDEQRPNLGFDQTLPRHLVHRTAVGEVFLTDAQKVEEGRVWIAAQLPRAHAYFHDHANQTCIDPMLLMEVCRQATLATAHFLEVPVDTTLISQDFHLDKIATGLDPAALIELIIESTFEWTRFQRGIPRAGVCRQKVYTGDILVCEHSSQGVLLKKSDLAYLRECARGTQNVLTSSFVDSPYPDAVAPTVLGRRDPLNVVLTGLTTDALSISAAVSPRWGNRALLDHSYDHLTMQILIEASRQLGHLALLDASPLGDQKDPPAIAAVSGLFDGFAELDSPVRVSTQRLPRELPIVFDIPVDIRQNDRTIATVTIHCTKASGSA